MHYARLYFSNVIYAANPEDSTEKKTMFLPTWDLELGQRHKEQISPNHVVMEMPWKGRAAERILSHYKTQIF